MIRAGIAIPLALCAFYVPCALAEDLVIVPKKDNTIYSNGDTSNGAGEHLFAGATFAFGNRRALIAFDVASALPDDVTVDSVSLSLLMSRTHGTSTFSLHRLTTDWGEGLSDAFEPGGTGAPAADGDATWNHTFFSTTGAHQFWTNPGGDFVATPSGSGPVASFEFTISTGGMLDDARLWAASPASNFGWILIGNESQLASAQRFGSRENFDPAARPMLQITYSPPFWDEDSDGTWGLASNWSHGKVPDGPNAAVALLDKTTAPRTLKLDGNRTLRSLRFDHFHPYTIAPGTPANSTLTIGQVGASGALSSGSGGNEISAKVLMPGTTTIDIEGDGGLAFTGGIQIGSSQTATKLGDGLITINGPQTHQPGSKLMVASGYLYLRSNAGAAATPTQAASANLSIGLSNPTGGGVGSFLIVDSSQDLAGFDIGFNDPGSQGVDLASTADEFHSISVHSGDIDAAKAAMAAAIRNANQMGAPDNMDGIYDAGLHANSGIGVAKLVDAHGDLYVLVRATRIGDLNLDGSVTISDFIDLASNFGATGAWQEGDLNNDGMITISDFIDLASNFGTSYAGDILPASDADRQLLGPFAASHGIALVPEPAALALLLLPLVYPPRRASLCRRRASGR